MSYTFVKVIAKSNKPTPVLMKNQGLDDTKSVTLKDFPISSSKIGDVYAVLTDDINFTMGKYEIKGAPVLVDATMERGRITGLSEPRACYSTYLEGKSGSPPPSPGFIVQDPKEPTPRTKLEKRKEKHPTPTIEEDGFYVDEPNWIRSVSALLRGRNCLFTGPTGSGKTELCQLLAKRFKRNLYVFDMGTMLDPVTGLIGTHRLKDGKSVFDFSRFVTAIKDSRALILLDEVNRSPATATNILLPCLDSRRTLYTDMADSNDHRVVPVDEGVVFFATANLGSQYVGTNELDRAYQDRFSFIELDYLSVDNEASLLKKRTGIEANMATIIAKSAEAIRRAYAEGALSTSVSTRHTLEVAEDVSDGYPVVEAMQNVWLPLYSKENNGAERTKVTAMLIRN